MRDVGASNGDVGKQCWSGEIQGVVLWGCPEGVDCVRMCVSMQ